MFERHCWFSYLALLWLTCTFVNTVQSVDTISFAGWQNCSTLELPSFTPPNERSWKSYGFGCSSIVTPHFNNMLEHKRSPPVFYYGDISEEDLCNHPGVLRYFNGTSCYEHFCLSEDSDLIRDLLLSHCMYCKDNRDDFEIFHEALLNGTCNGLLDVNPYRNGKYCSKRQNVVSNVVQNGIPLFYEDTRFCYCPYHDKIGSLCDGYTLIWMPYKEKVEPIITLVVSLLLLFILVTASLIPCMYKSIKDKRREGYPLPMIRFSVIALAFMVYLLIIFQSIVRIVDYKRDFSPAFTFFADLGGALSYVFTFTAFYTYLLSWVQILYRANSLDRFASLPYSIKIAAIPTYILCILIALTDVVSVIVRFVLKNDNEPSRYLSLTGLIITAIAIFVTGIGMIIYGMRLYLALRKASKVSFSTLKFTRLMCAISFVLLCMFVHMIMIAVLRIEKAEDVFGFGFVYIRETLETVYMVTLCALLNVSTYSKKDLKATYTSCFNIKSTTDKYVLYQSAADDDAL